MNDFIVLDIQPHRRYVVERRQLDSPAAALNKFCSIRTLNRVYTEFWIDPNKATDNSRNGHRATDSKPLILLLTLLGVNSDDPS